GQQTARSRDYHVATCDSTDRSYSKAAVCPVSCIWCGSGKSLPCELQVWQMGTLELLNKVAEPTSLGFQCILKTS
ncbi:hypothetical protein LEMLEM_LOCUS13673, partial [Lemmus lemmus]